MIAISSHRPHVSSEEFARTQSLAKRTWEPFFEKIIYVGPEEPELKSQKTTFVNAEDFPPIYVLAVIAARQPKVTAILNADIFISPELRRVEHRLQNRSFVCASSRRWHFDMDELPSLNKAQLKDTDRGRDIFVATMPVWQTVARDIPRFLRIGHQQWDAWMTDFFNTYKPAFLDFTHPKCIFHPKHEDRRMPYAKDIVEAKV